MGYCPLMTSFCCRVVFIASALLLATTVTAACPSGYALSTLSGRCLMRLPGKSYTYTNASAACTRNSDGILAPVVQRADMNALAALCPPGSTCWVYIAQYVNSATPKDRWVTGYDRTHLVPVPPAFWAPGEPNDLPSPQEDNQENCAVFADGTLRDKPCRSLLGSAVCSLQGPGTPPPPKRPPPPPPTKRPPPPRPPPPRPPPRRPPPPPPPKTSGGFSTNATGPTSIGLPNVFGAGFPIGSFPNSTAGNFSVENFESAPKDIFLKYEGAAAMFRLTAKSQFYITINVRTQPAKDVSLTLKVPGLGIPSTAVSPIVYVLFFNRFDDLETWEGAPDALLASPTEVRATLPPWAFLRVGNSTLRQALVLLTFHALNSSSTSRVVHPAVSSVHRTGSKRELLADGGAATCDGTSLQRPLPEAGHPVSSNFGPRKLNGQDFHYGTDFRAPVGSDVSAAQDGTLTVREERGKDGNYKGWGYYVIVAGPAGTTLYAHLTAGSAGPKGTKLAVKAGDVIARSGNTGRSSGPHLHFEYAPNGEIFDKTAKVDPAPCFEKLASGSISIRDNGILADDAFSVYLNGNKVCSTAIGAANSCTLGSLRTGTYELKVVVNIAPDDVGTYEISVTDSRMTICDTSGCATVKSNAPPQGTVDTYVLKVAAS